MSTSTCIIAIVAVVLIVAAAVIRPGNGNPGRRHNQRRQGPPSRLYNDIRAEPWPDGWKGIPKSESTDHAWPRNN